MDLNKYLKIRQEEIEIALDKHLPDIKKYPRVIHEAMRYSIFAGGKRLRPILCLVACEIVKGDMETVLPVACSLELIHTYSLIHDDLPAMDNDDLRRGKPTNHIVYGQANAILAGDALLTYAFKIISEAGLRWPEKSKEFLEVSKEIAEASGTDGMISGQVVDILSENQLVDFETLKYIHKHKTGALIKASVRSGALLGGGTKEQIDALTLYAENVGLAFQITDDLLDELGTEESIGKPVGSDKKNQKATYPSILGIEKTQQLAKDAIDSSIKALEIFGKEADGLRSIASYLLIREN